MQQKANRHARRPALPDASAVRVKRCGKSAPAAGDSAGSANPTRSKAKQGAGGLEAAAVWSGPLPTPG